MTGRNDEQGLFYHFVSGMLCYGVAQALELLGASSKAACSESDEQQKKEPLEENKKYKCPQCGKVAGEDDEVCSECGVELWSCNSCGAPILATTTKCPECGLEFGEEEEKDDSGSRP